MSILDRVVKHFDSKATVRIEVPEWADEKGNPTVLFSEPFTLAERQKLSKMAHEDDLEFIVRLIIMKCKRENGDQAFDLSDKPTLMHKADPEVVSRISSQIVSTKSVEDMTGN
jgi:hypothetical protein